MAWHLYILPIINVGTEGARIAKYLNTLPVSWAMIDYGQQPSALAAADLTPAQNTALVANSDVFAIPDNLDSTIVGVAAFKQAFEGIFIPAQWITGSETYRSVLRSVWGMFATLQRYVNISGNPAPIINGTTVTLSTQFRNLDVQVQTDLIATANSLGLDISGLSGNNTLRNILKSLSDSWGSRPFVVGGITV